MGRAPHRKDDNRGAAEERPGQSAKLRPTDPERGYLERGLTQAGGRLPLFDRDGRKGSKNTIESRIAHGWAAPWANNPVMPDWLVCRLTRSGYRVLGQEAPAGASCGRPASADR